MPFRRLYRNTRSRVAISNKFKNVPGARSAMLWARTDLVRTIK